jgi:D-tyrosyl-tRNA(Tyr) deacylase
MRAVLQRVSSASVTVDGAVIGEIGPGWLALLGVKAGDGTEQVAALVDKTLNLRAFPDDDGKMNRSVLDVGGAVLAVSQFTLYGDTRKGRRPSFTDAAPAEVASKLYEDYVAGLKAGGVKVATGKFQAHMHVALVNDGPVTLIVEA